MTCKPPILVPACPHPGEDCPRPHYRVSDPHNPPLPRIKPDPRVPLPCITSGCCACRPGPLPKKPMMATLKLRQLADCYNCRLAPECSNRRVAFYQHWQTFLDRQRHLPNTDYSVYCCDDYVDLGVNNDFLKWDKNLDRRVGPRKAALLNYLFMKNMAQVHGDMQRPYNECARYESWLKHDPRPAVETLGVQLEKSVQFRDQPALSRWYELMMRPEYEGCVPGSTIYTSRIRPFHKDSSFTTPVETSTYFPSGNDSPFKELRDIKKNM